MAQPWCWHAESARQLRRAVRNLDLHQKLFLVYFPLALLVAVLTWDDGVRAIREADPVHWQPYVVREYEALPQACHDDAVWLPALKQADYTKHEITHADVQHLEDTVKAIAAAPACKAARGK
jgi:hypothetical protein